ncbi:MAG: thioredoxin [Oscillospiraceae bacterium]|jgi:thioredoxin 1|nr:thioredoxin [Oscillospiraceae bacterium]
MAILHLTTDNFNEAVASGTVLVDFWADWCGPCKMLAPIIEELAEEYAESVTVAKLDTDAHGEIAAALGIQGIPTVILYRDGAETARFVGVQPKARYAEALA